MCRLMGLMIRVVFLCAVLLVSGCQKAPMVKSLWANDYLEMASGSVGVAKERYNLQAAQAFLEKRSLVQARNILNQMSPVDVSNRSYHRVLSAYYQLLKNKPARAIALLKPMDGRFLAMSQQLLRLNVLATAFWQNKAWQKSLDTYNQLLALPQTKEAHYAVVENVWHLMLSMPLGELEGADALTVETQGWVDLAVSTRQAPTGQDLAQAVKAWQAKYPKHPAQIIFKEKNSLRQAPQAQHVVLMLPTTGPYSSNAAAIKNGFLAAYYAQQGGSARVSQIQVVNSASGSIAHLYDQAVKGGAQMIIGPLTKENVALLARHRLSVPVLALNRVPQGSKAVKHLYQFGLSPIDEAQQVANRAYKQNHHSALVIGPGTPWGLSVTHAFMSQWQSLGGQVVAIENYTNNTKLKQAIEHALNVDQSVTRQRGIQRSFGQKVRYLPRRRQDIDMVFLVATPTMASQVKPLLSYYFAGNLTVYATSSIYSAQNSINKNKDLDGIIFCDIPWLIRSQQMSPELESMQQHIQMLWQKNYKSQARLYALGIDAYNLSNKISQLKEFPRFGISGASGTLFLTPNRHIYRQLSWAKIIHGKAEHIP